MKTPACLAVVPGLPAGFLQYKKLLFFLRPFLTEAGRSSVAKPQSNSPGVNPPRWALHALWDGILLRHPHSRGNISLRIRLGISVTQEHPCGSTQSASFR